MGLFNKKPKVAVCDVCGKADVEGCGNAFNHVEQITADSPSWLPANMRTQAQGEYAWQCLLCNSYPAMKWPHDGGASAALDIHLGQAHRKGSMADMASAMPRVNMIPAN